MKTYLKYSMIFILTIFSNLTAKDKNMTKTDKIICIETNQGTIEIKLKPDVAPKACENFITHVNNHYYDGIIFHRVIKDFMVQTGDPTGTGTSGKSCWGKAFKDELRADIAFDKKGIVAMANSGPNTNGSQFFITTAKTPWLNMHHTIFGEVVKGYDVVEKIENTKTGFMDKPEKVQKIIKAYLKKD
jgi:peptidylprolyl isomerase